MPEAEVSSNAAASPPKAAGLQRQNTTILPRSGTSKGKKSEAAIAPVKKFDLEVSLDGFVPSCVAVQFDIDGPLTLSWDADILLKSRVGKVDEGETDLPKGACVFYLFPTVFTELEPRGVQPTQAGVGALRAMISCLALQTSAFDVSDPVGAFPLHALMVCNTDASIATAMAMYKHRPRWLMQVHAKGPYAGESALHIALVNQREEHFISMVRLAMRELLPGQVEDLLRAQPDGVFFERPPMRFYGSTALAYACCFGMRESVVELVSTGHVGFNRREDGCHLTGFLPVHATICSSQEHMYDFITQGLPREWRADIHQVTRVGRLPVALELASLTPLQLAATLGDRALVRHILKQQCQVMWVWGPVTQLALDLKGIDSTGEGGNDLMELIVRVGGVPPPRPAPPPPPLPPHHRPATAYSLDLPLPLKLRA